MVLSTNLKLLKLYDDKYYEKKLITDYTDYLQN